MGVSIIIPTLNAQASLPATLKSIGGTDEVVVVDGGSRDDTVALARDGGARVVETARGRGHQLHAGAGAAGQDWLLFIHADTVLAPDWRGHVDAARARAGATGFAHVFGFKLAAPDWQARVLEAGVALRVYLFALPYGDQGLLIHRTLYDALGGYRPLPLMEDVDFIRRVGRRRLRRLPCAAITSAQRWREGGWLRRSARNLACLTMFSAGAPIERIARFYER